MSDLSALQRRMAKAVMQPLTEQERMRPGNVSDELKGGTVADFIKPNERLSAFERLEIYNRQYWFRLFSSFEEDFPGLQAVVGEERFQLLMRAYLEVCPSTSFSLRDLGSKLVEWLQKNPQWTGDRSEAAISMARLEWAHIEAFDGALWPRLTVDDLAKVGEQSRLTLQPHLRLVEVSYAVDDALIAVRRESGSNNASSNNASTGHASRELKAISRLKRERLQLAVHRYEDTVYYRRIGVEDYRLLQALRLGASLGEAIEAAFVSSAIPEVERPVYLQSAFGYWTRMGWFCTKL